MSSSVRGVMRGAGDAGEAAGDLAPASLVLPAAAPMCALDLLAPAAVPEAALEFDFPLRSSGVDGSEEEAGSSLLATSTRSATGNRTRCSMSERMCAARSGESNARCRIAITVLCATSAQRPSTEGDVVALALFSSLVVMLLSEVPSLAPAAAPAASEAVTSASSLSTKVRRPRRYPSRAGRSRSEKPEMVISMPARISSQLKLSSASCAG